MVHGRTQRIAVTTKIVAARYAFFRSIQTAMSGRKNNVTGRTRIAIPVRPPPKKGTGPIAEKGTGPFFEKPHFSEKGTGRFVEKLDFAEKGTGRFVEKPHVPEKGTGPFWTAKWD